MAHRPTDDEATPICRLAQVATNTTDLDRYVEFYGSVLGLGAPAINVGHGETYRRVARWNGVLVGDLVVFEVPGFDPAAPSPTGRVGSVDHLGFSLPNVMQRTATVDRLVGLGRSTGEQMSQLGWRSVRFTDPDGVGGEVVWHTTRLPTTRPP